GFFFSRRRPHTRLPGYWSSGRCSSDPVSYHYWQAGMGGRPAILGRTISVHDPLLTVVGVTPPRFQGTMLMLSFDVFVPATLAPSLLAGSRELEDRSLRGYSLLGRLDPAVTLAQAQDELGRTM